MVQLGERRSLWRRGDRPIRRAIRRRIGGGAGLEEGGGGAERGGGVNFDLPSGRQLKSSKCHLAGGPRPNADPCHRVRSAVSAGLHFTYIQMVFPPV